MTAMSTASSLYGLQDYVRDLERVLDRRPAMPVIVREAATAMKRLLGSDRWLDERCRQTCPDTYARHLLHRDRHNRFVVLALTWLPGQATPVHDHSCWGLMGLLENSLEEVHYERLDDGSRADRAELRQGRSGACAQGDVAWLLPPYEEIHRIGCVGSKPAISIHVYGRDLDAVNVFDPVTGRVSPMRIKYYSTECGKTPFQI